MRLQVYLLLVLMLIFSATGLVLTFASNSGIDGVVYFHLSVLALVQASLAASIMMRFARIERALGERNPGNSGESPAGEVK